MGYKTNWLEKILDEVIDQRIERKINRHLEMMNHLSGMKIACLPGTTWYLSIDLFFAQRLLDGVLKHFAEGW